MALKLTMVASDTLRLMIIIFEVLGDSIVGMSKHIPVPNDNTDNPPARPATATVTTRSKKKGKNKKQVRQVETLDVAQRAAMAESQRLERIKTLQRRFVQLHVAEKTSERKSHLLGLCERHCFTQALCCC